MKYFALLIFNTIPIGIVSAQVEICKNVYVWNFLNEEGKQDRNTRLITEEFENSLTQHNDCYVLERRDFSKGYEHTANEKDVLSLNDIQAYQVELKTSKTEIVVFGKLTKDEITNVYVLKVKFQNIETSQIRRAQSLNIPADEVRNLEQLHTRIDNFVCKIIRGSECRATTPPKAGSDE